MEYINGKEKYGIKYDLHLIQKEYKSLGIPSEFDYIDFKRFYTNKYIVDMSQRSLGKTTNYLLLGMVFNKIYGTTVCYLRENRDMVKPTYLEHLCSVIKDYKAGHYINKLTDGRYNTIVYYRKALYYANSDGKNAERASEPFAIIESIDNSDNVKSTLNVPKGDFIIFDEFISQFYARNSFVNYMNLLSTIIRDRLSPYIIMLANNININSPWFAEMLISRDIRDLQRGQTLDIKRDDVPNISVRLMDNKNVAKNKVNSLFFKFQNDKMVSITGNGNWSFGSFTALPNKDYEYIGDEIILLLESGDRLSVSQIDIDNNIRFYVKPYTKSLTGKEVYCLDRQFVHYNYKLPGQTCAYLKDMYNRNYVYFANNQCGADFLHFVKMSATKDLL